MHQLSYVFIIVKWYVLTYLLYDAGTFYEKLTVIQLVKTFFDLLGVEGSLW
jgi:hypothetical protein